MPCLDQFSNFFERSSFQGVLRVSEFQPFTKNFSQTRAQPSQFTVFSGLVRRRR